MKRKLTMQLPEGFAQALSRRHHGADRSKEEIKEAKFKLDRLYKKYCKNKQKLDLLYIEWDEKKIEDYFQEPIWYNAHRRRARYEKNMKDCHRSMFYILTNFDGNGREKFCGHNSISADEIMDDFKGKYLIKYKFISTGRFQSKHPNPSNKPRGKNDKAC